MVGLSAFDRPIAFHVAFARITGSVDAGLFLSQAYYWANRTSDPDGWFYKNQEEWTAETYLSRREQEKVRKTLRQLGILEEKLVGVPARLYYRINHQRTLELLEKSDCPFSAIQDAPNEQTRLSPTDKLDCTKPPNWIAPNRQTIYIQRLLTENTTERKTPLYPPTGGRLCKPPIEKSARANSQQTLSGESRG